MNKSKFIFLTLAVLAICSCTDMAELDTAPVSDAAAIDALVQTAVSSDAVTLDDIRSIATSTPGKTRTSSTAYTVSSINDAEGNPAIYVINFENDKGFILVSATKNYLPVLAYSDTGNFAVSDDMPEGLKMWKDETVSAIEYVNTLPEDSVAKYRDSWKQYEEPTIDSNVVSTLSTLDPELEEAYATIRSFVSQSVAEGYDILDIDGEMTGDASLDDEIREFLQGYIYPLYMDLWDVLSVVRTKGMDASTTVDNFMETTWDQENGYNYYFPLGEGDNAQKRAYAGCGPVAAGQIMCYYKYPAFFDWDSMLPDYYTTTTAAFLYSIAIKANAKIWENGSQETGTTIDDINSMLNYYRYTTTMGDHKAATAWKNIQNKMPVYMRANDSNNKNGHAWVASGGQYYYYYTTYEIYTFSNSTKFICANTYNRNYLIGYYFYMNWGWGGKSNGMYLDSSLVVPIGTDAYTAEDRQDIYDITPQ